LASRKQPRSRKPSKKAEPTFNASRLKQDVDTYIDAIYALLALVNHARWNHDEKTLRGDVTFGIGRRMTTSKANRTVPETDVTPDCIIQLGASAGVVAEAKPGVARSKAIWEENLKQVGKYDDNLRGWWTDNELIPAHDIVALVPLPRAVDFVDLVEAQIRDGVIAFERPFAIVAFVKNTGAEKTWVILKTEYGQISDSVLRERLRRAVPIDWQLLLTGYRDPKFIDVEPPLPYTLYVLWDYVFSRQAAGKPSEAGQNWITLKVEVRALARETQEFYGFTSEGPRSVEIPRQKWIRRALDALVIFGMAKRESESQYLVKYRRHRTNGDTVTFFGRLCFRNEDRLARAASKKPLLEIAEAGVPAAETLPGRTDPVSKG